MQPCAPPLPDEDEADDGDTLTPASERQLTDLSEDPVLEWMHPRDRESRIRARAATA